MNALPIVERELRVASRRRGTYWNRTTAGLMAVLISGFLLMEVAQSVPREVGQILFQTLSLIFGLLSLLAGVRYTADCLSEEKRAGTLGLLFLTDLKGYDVVLGKLVATSVHGASALLAIVPVLALPLLMGGVSHGECARMVLVLVNAMFFSLAAGLLVSAVSRKARRAMGGTFCLILLVQAGFPAIGAYAEHQHHFLLADWIAVPSVAYAYLRISDLVYQAEPGMYWASMGSTHALGWLFLAGASVMVRRTWQDRSRGAVNTGWQRWWRSLIHGGEASARAFRKEGLECNPCFWLGARHRLRPILMWCVLGVIALLWTAGWLTWGAAWQELEVIVSTLFVMHVALKLGMASEASRRLGEERRSGTLALLLSTPLTEREVLAGQMLALRRQFWGPVLAVLALDGLVAVWGWHSPAVWSRANWAWFCFIGVSTLLADLYTLAWVGLWMGLRARHPNRATAGAVARVLVLPWLAWIGLLFLFEIWQVPGYMPLTGGYLTLWFLIGLGNNAVFLAWSWLRLRRDLRALAGDRHTRGRA